MAEITPGSGRKAVQRSQPGDSATAGSNYLELATSGIADAAGTCSISLGAVPTGSEWLIERLSVLSNSVLVSVFSLYRDQIVSLTRKTATPAGNDDVEDCSSPIWFPGGVNILAIWTGCTPGAECTINAQVRVI